MKFLPPLFFAGFATLVISAEPPETESARSNSGWAILPVPGVWEDHADGAFQDHDGFAWYRCQVTIPRGWNGRKLELLVSQVDNAHEVYFGGTKIGSAGEFPPKYENGLSAANRYEVPADDVRFGENNLIAIRVYDAEGKGGFKGPAPVLIAGENAIALNGRWEFRAGDDLAWAKGPVALTSTGIFWRNMPTKIALENAEGPGALSPEQAIDDFALPDDLQIEVAVAEPHVRQPVFFNFDERGRMWVMQYLQYPYPAGLTMVSKDKFWRAVYDKVPPAPPNHFRGADKITIHEDTDGDGRYDRHKTFVDGLSIATSFVRGRGGVWVLNPPYLLFYPDRDGDDVPDSDPEVHLSGFGLEDTHSVVNSLRWGPDGWLYAAQGSTVSGQVIRPEIDKQPVHSMGQLIWRYHPESRRYEIFAEGGGNAFGVEFDVKGRVFSGHNGGDTRGFHYVQGGYYRKGFGKHGPLSNPYSFGYFSAMKHERVPRFTHNFVIYEADVLPNRYHGKLFGVEPLQGQIVQSEISRDGSSFQTKDLNRIVTTEDRRFRPVDIKVGPDGAIYVADFYEPQISHREHFSGQIDKSDGRIYRVTAKHQESRQARDLAKLSTGELVELLEQENKWTRQTALRLIGDRRDASVIPLLNNQLATTTGQVALESLWALNLCGGFDAESAAELLGHADPFVRLWTVRLIGDWPELQEASEREQAKRIYLYERMADLADNERNVEVRSQLACTSRRLPAEFSIPIVRQLLHHDEDAGDVHMPLLLWWGIETAVRKDPEAVLEMFDEPTIWNRAIVKEHILHRLMQRFALAGRRADLLACARLLERSPGEMHSNELMNGFEAAFKGRSLTGLPAELLAALSKAGGGSLLLRVRQRDEKAISEALTALANPKTELNKRLQLAETFGEVEEEKAVSPLLDLVRHEKDDSLRMTALTALQNFSDESIATAVLAAYQSEQNPFSDDVRLAAEMLLSSRKNWALAFLQAVDRGEVAKDAIPLDIVRRMTIYSDDQLAAIIAKHWSDVEGASNAEMQQRIQTLSAVIKSSSGDPYAGKELYKKSCGKCHLMYGEGGRIGPDLTTYKRDDTLRMLLNVVNPSAEVREGFETYVVLTEDGRTATGFLVDQDNQVVVLRGADGQNVTLRRSEIEEMLPQKKSLMPEGLLKEMSDQQVRDLFAFLRGSQPLND